MFEFNIPEERLFLEDVFNILDQHDEQRKKYAESGGDWGQEDMLVSDLYKSLTKRKRNSFVHTPFRAKSGRVWRFRGSSSGYSARANFEKWLEEIGFEITIERNTNTTRIANNA